MLLSSLQSLTRITLPADRGTRSTCIPACPSRNHDVRPTHWLPPQNRISARHGVSARASSVAATPSLNADDGAEREIKEGVYEGTPLPPFNLVSLTHTPQFTMCSRQPY